MNVPTQPQQDPGKGAAAHEGACPAGQPLGCRALPGSHGRRRTRFRPKIGRALMALALGASVLAAGPSPVGGAAAEVEVPTRLAGATRYETAVKIAEAYVAEVQSDASRAAVDTVILTSGRDAHFGYALPTPALARLHEAPVLLTEPDALPSAVTTFLTQPEITTVYIVGDTSVVSAAVESDIAAISGLTVSRIANVDTAYAAAVSVAELVGWRPGSPGQVRGKGATALLATGENFADALAAGPLAYRGEHPILLTRQAELPADVSAFLSDSGTEHVIILGGDAAVSATVENGVKALDITVERWKGATRFGTAIDIAEALMGFDTPQECFDSSGNLGLAYGWRSPDAIVSGPLLGEQCAPLLLTERDALPTSVGDFLESDDFVRGDASGKLRFTVFGGQAAVADSALNQAVDAAELVALGATFEAIEGHCQFTVRFDEPVVSTDAANAANYLNGNSPFTDSDIEGSIDVGSGTSTTTAVITLVGGHVNPNAAVPTGCTVPLRARDRIGIVGNGIRAAAVGDNRRVDRVEHFVADDDTPPMLTLNATEGGAKVWMESTEPLVVPVRDNDAVVTVVFKRSGIPDETLDVSIDAGVTRFEADVPNSFGTALKIGDSVSIAADEVHDLAGNANQSLRRVVVRDTTPPRAARITATEPTAVAQAFATLDGTDANDNSTLAVTVTAKAGTAADGAVGNEWTIDLNKRAGRLSGWSADQLASVQVSAAARRILIVALVTSDAESSADIDDVVDAMNAHRPFTSLFTATVQGSSGPDTPVDTGGRKSFAGGASTVDLTLEWSEAVRTGIDPPNCTLGIDPEVKVRLIEFDADGDGSYDFGLDGYKIAGSDVSFTIGDGNPSFRVGGANCDTTTPGALAGTLVARLRSASLENLPSTRSTALIRSGAVTDLAGNTNGRQSAVPVELP